MLLPALISIIIGAIICFSGYRIFRFVLMLVGFLIGFTLGASLMSSSGGAAQIIVGVVVGLVGAGLFYVLYFVGVFLAGAGLGAALGLALASILGASGGVVTILALIGLVGGAILAIILNKLMIVLSTAFGGAGSIVQGLALLLPGAFGLSMLSPYGTGLNVNFLGFIIWLALGIAGFVVQYRQNKAQIESKEPL